MFVDRYLDSINSSNLIDDATHHACSPLAASAFTDSICDGIGALLARVKFGSSIPKSADYVQTSFQGDIELQITYSTNLFEGSAANLAELTRKWREIVKNRGLDRKWFGKYQDRTEWDMNAALTLFRRIADRSLAYWLDGRCIPCQGSGQVVGEENAQLRIYECQCCQGTGKEYITGRREEVELIRDMISEIEGAFQSYNRRAGAKLRKNE